MKNPLNAIFSNFCISRWLILCLQMLGAVWLAPLPAWAQNNNVINGTTNADQCGHVYACPRVSGEASGGTLTIINSGEMIGGAQAYGGYTLDGQAYNNVFKMEGGYLQGGHGYGGYTGNGDAYNNKVIINDNSQSSGGNLYGGYSENGNARQNEVEVNKGNIYGNVYGGYTLNGNANYNKVTLGADGLVQTQLYGGYSSGGSADNNTVILNGGLAYYGVVGGYSDGPSASGNVVSGGGQITSGSVVGGRLAEFASGSADHNHVILESGSFIGRGITGGLIEGAGGSTNTADYNTVYVSGGWISGMVSGGWLDNSTGSASYNAVTLDNTTTLQDLYGGRVNGGRVEGNRVVLEDSTVNGSVYGGETQRGSAGDNEVTINNTQVQGNAYGGKTSANSDANDNTITVSNNSSIDGYLIGGATDTGNAQRNQVTVTGSRIGSEVYGGQANDGNVEENTVTITESTVVAAIYGGDTTTGSAVKNRLILLDSFLTDAVYGGHLLDGEARENTVYIKDGQVDGSVYGGYTSKGSAEANEVTTDGCVFKQDIYGGWSGEGGSLNNIVRVQQSTVEGDVFSGYTQSGDVTQNQTILQGGEVLGEVYGGLTQSGTADHNTVTVMDGAVIKNNVSGGGGTEGASSNMIGIRNSSVEGTLYGGFSLNGSASLNEVYIQNSQLDGTVMGGLSQSGSGDYNTVLVQESTLKNQVVGGQGRDSASHNQIYISGSTVGGDIIGGISSSGPVVNNTVTLGDALIGGAVYGGYSPNIGADVKTGNRLSVDGFQGRLTGVGNFEYYDFHLSANLAHGDTIITITGSEATDLTCATVDNITMHQDSILKTGDHVTLIDQVSGDFAAVDMNVAKGISTVYRLIVEAENGELVATVIGDRANPQTKALGQAFMAGITLLNQGGDLAMNQGLNNALRSTMIAEPGQPGVFTAASLSSGETKTGSHLEMDGWELMTGLAWKADRSDKSGWLTGVYFETGQGSYDGYNSFSHYGEVHSTGDTQYYGGGLISRYQWASGFHGEAGVRIGRVKTNYTTEGYLSAMQPDFDFGTNYYGASFGLGYKTVFTRVLALDITAHYLWTMQEGKQVRVMGEEIKFDSVNSHRARLGSQLTYEANPVVAPYIWIWLEHEFDGRADSRNLDIDVRHAALKTEGTTGGSGMGFNFNPLSSDLFNIDLGVQAYTGRRKGVGGNLAMILIF